MSFTVRSAGIPDARTKARVASASSAIARWEVVVPPRDFAAALDALAAAPDQLPLAIAPVVPLGPPDNEVHHFVTSGFNPLEGAALAELLALDVDRVIDELVFRVAPREAIGPVVAAAERLSRNAGRRAIVNVELPRAGENIAFDDDEAVADRVEEAARAAAQLPDVVVFLDGFVDHDRSYYPRHGLIDRRFNPRPALHRLIEVASEATMPSAPV